MRLSCSRTFENELSEIVTARHSIVSRYVTFEQQRMCRHCSFVGLLNFMISKLVLEPTKKK